MARHGWIILWKLSTDLLVNVSVSMSHTSKFLECFEWSLTQSIYLCGCNWIYILKGNCEVSDRGTYLCYGNNFSANKSQDELTPITTTLSRTVLPSPPLIVKSILQTYLNMGNWHICQSTIISSFTIQANYLNSHHDVFKVQQRPFGLSDLNVGWCHFRFQEKSCFCLLSLTIY